MLQEDKIPRVDGRGKLTLNELVGEMERDGLLIRCPRTRALANLALELLDAVNELEVKGGAKPAEIDSWLQNQLAYGPVKSKDLRKRASLEGINDRAWQRAARRIGASHLRSGHRAESEWFLPG